MIRWGVLGMAVVLLYGAGQGGEGFIRAGKGDFNFVDKRGNPDRPVRVFYYAPRTLGPDTPILFVMHGRYRNAMDYRDQWIRYARKYGALLLVPEIREAYYPGSAQYQQGNICTTPLLSINDIIDWATFCRVIQAQARQARRGVKKILPGRRIWELLTPVTRKLVRSIAHDRRPSIEEQEQLVIRINQLMDMGDLYQRGAFSRIGLPKAALEILDKSAKIISLSQARWVNRILLENSFKGLIRRFRYTRNLKKYWTFSMIEHLFDHVRVRLKSRRKTYLIYGHSAGAQFVHRLVMLLPAARVKRAISANAGRYTMPSFEIGWPYGLRGTTCVRGDLRRVLVKPLMIMVGSSDTDSRDENLTTTRRAMAQGANRLERAKNFFIIAEDTAKKVGCACAWRLEIVPRATHDNTRMAPTAAKFLFVPGSE